MYMWPGINFIVSGITLNVRCGGGERTEDRSAGLMGF